MPFFLVKGTFHVVGYAPDGDSDRFEAENEASWARLSGLYVNLNAGRHAQLRFKGIDPLETHYQGTHQPLELATKALDYLLLGLASWRSGGTRYDPKLTRRTMATRDTSSAAT